MNNKVDLKNYRIIGSRRKKIIDKRKSNITKYENTINKKKERKMSNEN